MRANTCYRHVGLVSMPQPAPPHHYLVVVMLHLWFYQNRLPRQQAHNRYINHAPEVDGLYKTNANNINVAMTTTTQTNSMQDPSSWLEAHGDYLFRFAMKHLRDIAQAEDAVQDTLLAALQAQSNFNAASSQRTWLTGILKHKIIDLIRKQSRETAFYVTDSDTQDNGDALEASLFDERGEWVVPQTNWGNPETALEQERFWAAFLFCLDGLSPKLARMFSLRELSGLQTSELCEVLNITSANCWVILYRARIAMKECLESHWLRDKHEANL